jgi:hypothetical protein
LEPIEDADELGDDGDAEGDDIELNELILERLEYDELGDEGVDGDLDSGDFDIGDPIDDTGDDLDTGDGDGVDGADGFDDILEGKDTAYLDIADAIDDADLPDEDFAPDDGNVVIPANDGYFAITDAGIPPGDFTTVGFTGGWEVTLGFIDGNNNSSNFAAFSSPANRACSRRLIFSTLPVGVNFPYTSASNTFLSNLFAKA